MLDFLLDQWWYIDVFLLHSHFSHVQVILTLIIACFMETLQWSLEMRSLYWKKGPCLVFTLNSYYLQVAAIFCFYKISFSLRNFVMILNKVWKDQGKIFASVGIFYERLIFNNYRLHFISRLSIIASLGMIYLIVSLENRLNNNPSPMSI